MVQDACGAGCMRRNYMLREEKQDSGKGQERRSRYAREKDRKAGAPHSVCVKVFVSVAHRWIYLNASLSEA